jgi:fido (protein-threonine AMPylation protein)
MTGDPYLDPETGVLLNKLGITEAENCVKRSPTSRRPAWTSWPGNGRTARAFVRQLAADAGYRLDWSRIDANENVAAAIAAHNGDLQPMRALRAKLTFPVL